MLREVVLPALAPVLLFVAAVVRWRRHPVPRPRVGTPHGPVDAALLGHVARTVAGGYAAFVLLVIAFEWGIGDTGVAEAIVYGGILAASCGVAFVVLSWLEAVVRGRRC